jgi:hypothetical protein
MKIISSKAMLVSTAILAVSVSAFAQTSSSKHPSGVVDCRAGCQGSKTGCRESLQSAVIDADPGLKLMPETLRIIKRWNASDSPGLAGTPSFVIASRYPAGSNRPYSITVVPDLTSCTGISPHTQGVTFYELQVIQQP